MEINKIISAVLGIEFIYALYIFISSSMVYFSPAYFVLYSIEFIVIALLLVSAIGVYHNKKWGVIILWVYILIPLLGRFGFPFRIFIGGYYLLIINVIIATYLTTVFWAKKTV